MADRMAKSVAILLFLGTVIGGAPGNAEAQAAGGPTRKSSVAKRVAWTVVGAAAGFGAGAWFGLHEFDDATNSDRKVWTSAIVGAAAGGLAGGFLSRNIRPAPHVPPPWRVHGSQFTVHGFGSPFTADRSGFTVRPADRALRARIRTLNAER